MIHEPVMLNELIKGLNIKEDGFYMDLTFGAGGHSKAILNRLNNEGKLISFDLHSGCKEIASEIKKDHSNFEFILDNYVNYYKHIKKEKSCDGIVLDLGFSSDTLTLGRGFSYQKKNEALDMRYSLKSSTTAKRILNKMSYKSLLKTFKDLEVYKAKEIVEEVFEYKKTNGDIKITNDLISIVDKISKDGLTRMKMLKTLFQALRIVVNNELENLYSVLNSFSKWIKEGGVLAIICFHSLERKLVKKEFAKLINPLPSNFPLEIPSEFSLVSKKPLLPTKEEISKNKRSKSACLAMIRRN